VKLHPYYWAFFIAYFLSYIQSRPLKKDVNITGGLFGEELPGVGMEKKKG
jgi:hypothetical protein